MNTMKTTGIAAALALLVPFGSTAEAQEDQGAGYSSELKPGLHVSADSSDGSLLSQAARDRISVVITEGGQETAATTEVSGEIDTHEVKQGDTLWDICSSRFNDPYVWPRIWSYNPKVTNPHWIYPGDVLWLTPPNAANLPAGGTVQPSSAPMPADRGQRGNQGLLISNRGFVDKEILKRAGTVVGSQEEKSLLSQFDEAYVEFKDNDDVRPGDEFAVFEALREIDSVEDRGSEMGYFVEILGKVRVTSYDKDKGIARVTIPEAFQAIERGAMVGPVHQELQLVPAVANDRELKGHIVALFDPTVLAAQHQVVFVDRGEEQGVREGNRFFVVEKRDLYRKSFDQRDDRKGYPFEVVAELRVVEARPNTSTCLVTASVRELEVGAEVEMVKGY